MSTRYRLFAAGVVDRCDCVLCGEADETEEHLWFQCPYVKEVTEQVLSWTRISHRESSLLGWLEWFGMDPRHHSFMYESKLFILSGIVYFTWRTRNQKIFREESWPHSVCAKMIIDDCRRRIGVRSLKGKGRGSAWVDSLGSYE